MFQWYERAKVCLAYLEDVSVDSTDSDTEIEANFHQCRWFTRGWTLQELLAPNLVFFVDRRWTCFGHKSIMRSGYVDDPAQRNLNPTIEAVTGIPYQVLLHYPVYCLLYSIATRLSWAARRRTSRKEDMAYCLMGLFGINMPLMYGEGEHAMRRLQREIWFRAPDESLFAWDTRENPDTSREIPMLAPSMEAFKLSDNVGRAGGTANSVLSPEGDDWRLRLTPESPRILFSHAERKDQYILRLRCTVLKPEHGAASPCMLMLRKMRCGDLCRVQMDRHPEVYKDAGKLRSGGSGPATEDQILGADGWHPVQGSWDALVHGSFKDSVRCNSHWLNSRNDGALEDVMLHLSEGQPKRVALGGSKCDGPWDRNPAR